MPEGDRQKADDKEAADFKYIVRLSATDLDGKKPAVVALTKIKGVGPRIAEVIVNRIGFPRNEKIGRMSDEQVEMAEQLIDALTEQIPDWMTNRQRDFDTGESIHILGAELDLYRREDINRMKMIRCYRGIRHEQGQKVRGQRTRSNGRTGLTLGVIRKGGKPSAPSE
ncbi:MAG: 30S ribosomal protein S13 [Candidatus Thermoplasmatota archaeon]